MSIYQLVIAIDEIEPLIWRRLQVPGDVTLFQLNFIFQLAMGWNHSHLHEYNIDGEFYGQIFDDDDYGDDRDVKDEKDYRLDQVIPGTDFLFGYLYDFGDAWIHAVLVEDILEPEDGVVYPACLDGERACPPDDVGGLPGYAMFLEAITDPAHPGHEDNLAWIGGHFDADAFDPNRADKVIKKYQESEMYQAHQRYEAVKSDEAPDLYRGVVAWMAGLTSEDEAQMENLPIRRDAIAMLTYLRDHRVRGTKSTGNFPLKVVREIASRFVNPPILDHEIGDRVYKLRSEFDVYPIFFLHTLLVNAILLEFRPDRSWNVTKDGVAFLDTPVPFQVLFLLQSWWHQVNWLMEYPYDWAGDYIPDRFREHALRDLLELPAGQPTPAAEFADRLIESSGLSSAVPKNEHAKIIRRSLVEQVLIRPLEKFKVVEIGTKDVKSGNSTIKKIDTFRITNIGAGLLKMIAEGGI